MGNGMATDTSDFTTKCLFIFLITFTKFLGKAESFQNNVTLFLKKKSYYGHSFQIPSSFTSITICDHTVNTAWSWTSLKVTQTTFHSAKSANSVSPYSCSKAMLAQGKGKQWITRLDTSFGNNVSSFWPTSCVKLQPENKIRRHEIQICTQKNNLCCYYLRSLLHILDETFPSPMHCCISRGKLYHIKFLAEWGLYTYTDADSWRVSGYRNKLQTQLWSQWETHAKCKAQE